MSRGLRNGKLCRIGGSGLLWSFCENDFEEFEKFPDLRLGDDKRRQEAKREVVSTVDEQAALHGFANKRSTFDGKLDADHQALGTNFADEIEFGCELFESLAQFRSAGADIFEKFLFFNDTEEFQGYGARERTTAKGRAVHPRGNARGNCFGRENRAKWKAGCQRLGN